jgi:hypothetical protein
MSRWARLARWASSHSPTYALSPTCVRSPTCVLCGPLGVAVWLVIMVILMAPAAADSLYDADAAAARQAAARAVLAAQPGPSGPAVRAAGVRCTAGAVGLRALGAQDVACVAESVTLTLHGDPEALAALVRWVQIEAATVVAP